MDISAPPRRVGCVDMAKSKRNAAIDPIRIIGGNILPRKFTSLVWNPTPKTQSIDWVLEVRLVKILPNGSVVCDSNDIDIPDSQCAFMVTFSVSRDTAKGIPSHYDTQYRYIITDCETFMWLENVIDYSSRRVSSRHDTWRIVNYNIDLSWRDLELIKKHIGALVDD